MFIKWKVQRTIVVTNRLGIVCTKIVDAPFVRVLAASLVFKETHEEVFPERGVGVKKNGPSWEDDIDCVNVAVTGNFCRSLLVTTSLAYYARIAPFIKTMTSVVSHAPALVFEMVISMAPMACLIDSSTSDA